MRKSSKHKRKPTILRIRTALRSGALVEML
jgi:hypothetical protein